MITLNTGEQLDPKILKVMRAIRQVESGGDYNAVGDAGTSTGAFQFQGATWNTWAKKVLGDANAPKTKANQNKVAYYKIKELKDQGRTPREIALIWNGGEPVEKKGFNKKIGLAYDSGAYANKVMGILGSMPKTEMPQEPVMREVPEVAPVVPKPTFGTGDISGNIPGVKQLSNIGVGIGSAVGKTLLGAVQAPLRITGALGRAVGADTQYVDKAVGGIESVKQGMYQKPFEQQLSTTSGKTGQVIGTLAPFIATAGAVNPATAGLGTIPRVLARAGSDVAVSQAQTGGDMKTGLATGVTSAVADTLLGGKSKAVRGVIPGLKQVGKTTSAGYVSDVSSGVAGMRGEDRTGAKAFIPGAGTVIGGALGTAQTSISTLKDPVRKVTNIISKREKELQKLEDNYAIIRKVTSKTKAQGIDPKKILAQTDLLSGAVDNTGTLRTQNASIELNDFIKPQEKVISDNLRREGVLLNLKDVRTKLLNMIDSTGIKGGAKLRAIKNVEDDIAGLMLEADSTGKIPLSTIHDAKIDKYANINFLNPESKRVDKAIAKGLKELVESNTRSVDVKNLNRELQQHYSVLDLLEKLDGKKVEGGKLGKYFAQTVGGIVGSHFGPLGAIAGAEIGAGIKGAQMSSKFTGRTGIKLEQSEQMKEALIRSRQPRLGLPAPRDGSPRSTINSQNAIPLRNATRLPDEVQAPSANQSYSNNLGNRNTNQSTTIIPTRIGISKSITIPKGSSIDQTRAVVNNYLDDTLKNIADPDTFDVISANPQAFYREQIDNIAQGLKQGGTKYARLANSISSIDASKINNFETLASKIREKLNAKTFMEKITK